MGSPRKPKRQYSRPLKLWNKDRLDEERPLVKEFGLYRKNELWKTASLLRKYTRQAKFLIASRGEQAAVEKKQLIERLNHLGILDSNASLDDVLGLTVKNFLSRRLQTVVFRKKLSNSIKQSRQFITHRHIRVGGKIITSPSYLVPLAAEKDVAFAEGSDIAKIVSEVKDKQEKEVAESENAGKSG